MSAGVLVGGGLALGATGLVLGSWYLDVTWSDWLYILGIKHEKIVVPHGFDVSTLSIVAASCALPWQSVTMLLL